VCVHAQSAAGDSDVIDVVVLIVGVLFLVASLSLPISFFLVFLVVGVVDGRLLAMGESACTDSGRAGSGDGSDEVGVMRRRGGGIGDGGVQ
jgi:hypothetical protein